MNDRIKLLKHQASVWGDEMNKLIRELAEEAGASIEENTMAFPVVFGEIEDFEKFVEFIVRECVDCLKPLSRNHSMVGAAQDTIKAHFGIE